MPKRNRICDPLLLRQKGFFSTILKGQVLYVIWQFFILLGFWLFASGSFDWQHLVLGSAAALLLVMFWRDKSERIVGRVSARRLWLSAKTVVRLIYEIWKAAWQVVRIVLSRQMVLSPTLTRTVTKLKTDRMRVLFANSITLTPGTLTVQLDQDHLLVHGLTQDAAEGVATWDFENTLMQLEEAN